MSTARHLVALNELGYRIGETHQNARIPDAMVDRIRELHEDLGWGYKRIARDCCVAIRTVRNICNYHCRVQVAVRWRTVQG